MPKTRNFKPANLGNFYPALTGGVLFLYNYKYGTALAAAKAEEALFAEREKIGIQTIYDYKIAVNLLKIPVRKLLKILLNLSICSILNKYIKSKDINRYEQVKRFYKDFIKSGAEQYKSLEK